MPDKAVIRLMLLIIAIPLNRLSCRWISDLMYKAAGKTRQEFKEYLIKTRSLVSDNANQNIFYSWMIADSLNPKQFKTLHSVYQACTIPNIIILAFAVFGLFIPAFDTILDLATLAMLILPLALFIAGVAYRKRKSN